MGKNLKYGVDKEGFWQNFIFSKGLEIPRKGSNKVAISRIEF